MINVAVRIVPDVIGHEGENSLRQVIFQFSEEELGMIRRRSGGA